MILWNPGAVAAAVIGDDFAMADPVDPSKLPWPKKNKGNDVEQMLAASVGERNELLNKLAFERAKIGKETLTIAAAAIEAGLPDAEVAATIRSAEEGAERAKADTARAIASATTSEADLGAEYMRLHQGDRLHRSDDVWFRWADNAGWTLDPGANASLAEVMRLGRDTFCRASKEGPRPRPAAWRVRPCRTRRTPSWPVGSSAPMSTWPARIAARMVRTVAAARSDHRRKG